MTTLVLGANTVIDNPRCTIAFSTSSNERFGQQLGLLCLPLDERRKAIYSPVYLHSTTPWATLDNLDTPSEWQLDLSTLFSQGVHSLQLIVYTYHVPDVNLPAIEIDNVSLTINGNIHYDFKSQERHVKAVIVLELYIRNGVYKCRALGETSIQGLESIEQHVDTSLNADHPYVDAIQQHAQSQQTQHQDPQNQHPNLPNANHRPSRQVQAGEQWTGTAFAIDPYHLLTCYHVIESANLIGVRQQGERDLEAQVVISDIGSDMAIIKVNEPMSGYLPLALESDDLLGETIVALGFPFSGLNNQLQVTQGCISGLTGFDNDIRYMQFTAPIQPGSSGSPLLLPNGQVVGMVTASLAQAQNMNYAVKFQMLSALISSAGLAKPTRATNEPAPMSTPQISRQSRSALWMVGAQA